MKQVAPGQVGFGETRGLAQFQAVARRKKAFEVAVRRVEFDFQLLVRQDRLHKAGIERKPGERHALFRPRENRREVHDSPQEKEIGALAKLRVAQAGENLFDRGDVLLVQVNLTER